MTERAAVKRGYRTKWDEALRYFAAERELLDLAGTEGNRSKWRTSGVPADVLLPRVLRFYEELLARGLPPSGGGRLPEFVTRAIEIAKTHPKSAPIVLEVFRDLCEIHRADPELFQQFQLWVQAWRARVARDGEDGAKKKRSPPRARRAAG